MTLNISQIRSFQSEAQRKQGMNLWYCMFKSLHMHMFFSRKYAQCYLYKMKHCTPSSLYPALQSKSNCKAFTGGNWYKSQNPKKVTITLSSYMKEAILCTPMSDKSIWMIQWSLIHVVLIIPEKFSVFMTSSQISKRLSNYSPFKTGLKKEGKKKKRLPEE